MLRIQTRGAKRIVIPRGTVHFFRSKILWERTCQEKLRIHNYGRAAIDLSFSIEFDADFVDIFELRGTKRERRGRRLEPQLRHDQLVLAYEGLDHCLRRTRIVLDPPPTRLTESLATFQIRLEPGEAETFRCAIACDVNSDSRVHIRPSYEAVVQEAASAIERDRAEEAQIFTQNEQFNDLLNRSLADLHMMRILKQYGPYPYAGVPWFSAVFGRDGIITALEYLWVDPSLARGVLGYLAATQADSEGRNRMPSLARYCTRCARTKMAVTGEIPFRRYYGTIDATPFFVILAGAYYSRTGDRAFLESIWSNIERALSGSTGTAIQMATVS
jgi:glycogen debranching enzyme